MNIIDKFIQWLGKWIPYVWAFTWLLIITGLSIGVCGWVIKWILRMLGVM